MKHLTPKQAEAQGYESLTSDISTLPSAKAHEDERYMIPRFEADMHNCDAVWIDAGDGKVQLARKAKDLKTLPKKQR